MLKKMVINLLLERPVRSKAVGDWVELFKQSERTIQERVNNKHDSEFNRKMFSHVIGIERWGQRRLQVWLGEPFVEDEYNNYRPARDMPWEAMGAEFAKTRAQTVAIVQQLAAQAVDSALKVKHNQHGELSLKAWLRYLQMHAELETKRLK